MGKKAPLQREGGRGRSIKTFISRFWIETWEETKGEIGKGEGRINTHLSTDSPFFLNPMNRFRLGKKRGDREKTWCLHTFSL